MFGFLNVDKPRGLTSRRVVDRVKKIVRPWKTGHCGTLDPLATGVLVVCVGPATRLTSLIMEMNKRYVAEFRLGVSSPTDDLEGELTTEINPPAIDAQQLRQAVPRFCGQIRQKPPAYSAVKLQGKRAYRLARAGLPTPVTERTVQVDKIALTHFAYPDFQLDITCGSGTYIRSIGRDLAQHLHSAAVMTGLRRVAVGSLSIGNAIAFDELTPDRLPDALVAPAELFTGMRRIELNARQIRDLAHGRSFSADELRPSGDQQLAAVDSQGRLLALLQPSGSDRFKPGLNFVHYYLDRPQSSRDHQSREGS